ncbi:hypothetical protein NTH60_004702 [Enterobacter ludwigii]|nr:hypothetical protein [Enterobacter ludwigii]
MVILGMQGSLVIRAITLFWEVSSLSFLPAVTMPLKQEALVMVLSTAVGLPEFPGKKTFQIYRAM